MVTLLSIYRLRTEPVSYRAGINARSIVTVAQVATFSSYVGDFLTVASFKQNYFTAVLTVSSTLLCGQLPTSI
jgi:hypothetical protein